MDRHGRAWMPHSPCRGVVRFAEVFRNRHRERAHTSPRADRAGDETERRSQTAPTRCGPADRGAENEDRRGCSGRRRAMGDPGTFQPVVLMPTPQRWVRCCGGLPESAGEGRCRMAGGTDDETLVRFYRRGESFSEDATRLEGAGWRMRRIRAVRPQRNGPRLLPRGVIGAVLVHPRRVWMVTYSRPPGR